jgi:hypothetical protein
MVVLDSTNTTLDTLNTDVHQLLGKASREQLLPVYTEAKSLVCCMMPDAAASMWMGLTFAGEGWHYMVLRAVPLLWLLVHTRTPRKPHLSCSWLQVECRIEVGCICK